MEDTTRFYPAEFPKGQSILLLGPRKTGKTTFLKQKFPDSIYIDFLQSDVLRKYSANPERLRQELLLVKKDKQDLPVIIDEVQLIPELLNEIHWLIDNTGLYFILCGSSVRKIRAAGVNLLGGRVWTYHFFPFTYRDFKPYDLPRILERGAIPSHYLSSAYAKHLQAYVHDYLTFEIKQEGAIRNLPAFQRFLEVAAFSSGELINYANIAREAGISEKTIKSYFDILEDSLVASRLSPFSKVQKRELIFKTNKFYFFDVGLINALKRNAFHLQTQENQGHILESYIFQELNAYRKLRENVLPLTFWRTTTGLEVDFILNNDIAIEVKLAHNIHQTHLKSLVAFANENQTKELIVVCNEKTPRLITHKGHNIKIFNTEAFLDRLWGDEFI